MGSVLVSPVFWGIVIVFFGLSIIIKEFTGFNIPVFKIVAGLFFIWIGVRILNKGFYNDRTRRGGDVVFGSSRMNYEDGRREYNIVFGNGSVDLSHMAASSIGQDVEVNIVFGNGQMLVPDSLPVKMEINTAFASAVTPERHAGVFGSFIYTSPAYRQNAPFVNIEANVVFGKMDVIGVPGKGKGI